jgi:hypothetical protein
MGYLLDLETIPFELRALGCWVLWRYGDLRPNGKRAKVPYQPDSKPAKVNNSATWSLFEAVKAAYLNPFNAFDGIGFVFAAEDDLVGIDLDNCVSDDGTIAPWAARILAELLTYWEYSPSGRGLHGILRGSLPAAYGDGAKRSLAGGGGIEVYQDRRFFTVTAAHVPDTPTTIEPLLGQLEAFLARELPRHSTGVGPLNDHPFFRTTSPSYRLGDYARHPPVEAAVTDGALLDGLRLRFGQAFCALYDRGDISAYDGDHSAADLALFNYLIQGCGPDPARIDRLFRRSALMRPKWDEYRGAQTYGQLTIAKGIGSRHMNSALGLLLTIRADEVHAQRTTWFAPDRIPFAAMTLLDGPGDIGKTTTLTGIIASASVGRCFFIGEPMEPVTTLIVVEEDSLGVLKMRLQVAGADLSRIHFITGVRIGDAIEPFTLPRHVVELESKIEETGARLVYVDALFSHLELDGDGRMPQQVRRSLRPIVEMVGRTGVAFVAVRHWTKASGAASMRALGSVELGNIARSTLSFGRHPEANDRYVIAATKHNMARPAPTLVYRIEVLDATDDDGQECPVTRVVLDGEAIDVTADDLAMQQPGDPDERGAAQDWLADYLADGDWHDSAAIYKAARKDGAGSPATMRRARKRLGAEIDRSGFPACSKWRLPTVRSQFAHSDSVSNPEQSGERTESTTPSDGKAGGDGKQGSVEQDLRRAGGPQIASAYSVGLMAVCLRYEGGRDGTCQRCGASWAKHLERRAPGATWAASAPTSPWPSSSNLDGSMAT